MKNKILITGGAGYIGSKLASRLISDGHGVIVIDDLSTGKKTNLHPKVKLYKTSILSEEILSILKKEKPDLIFHLAASKDVSQSVVNPVEFAKINILGSLNIIDAAYKAGVRKIVFTSTAGVYGDSSNGVAQKESDMLNPSSPYAWTKLAVEEYLIYMNKNYGMENIILRFANVYGPGGVSEYKSVVNIFVDRLLKNQEIIIHGDGKQTRDYIYIDDLVDLCISFIKTDLTIIKKQPVFNVSTGTEISVTALLKTISEIAKVKPQIQIKINTFYGQRSSLLDTERTKRILKWHSRTSLRTGIKKMIKAIKEK